MFRFIIFIAMCLVYIVQGFISNEAINKIYILVCVIAFLLAFKMLKNKAKMLTGFLFFSGIFIHLVYGNQWLLIFDGITQNIALLSIILLAPLLSFPMEAEGIIDTFISKLNENKNDERKTFYGISVIMLILAPILNMGVLRIVNEFVSNLKIKPKILSRSYYAGFTQAMVWSPFFSSVGIVISIAEIPYMAYMPIGVFFSFLMFLTAIFILRPPRSKSVESIESFNEAKTSAKDFIMLIFIVIFLVCLLILLEFITKLPMLLLVSINCLVIPLIWTLVRKKWKWMKSQIKLYKKQMEEGSNMEIALFLGAGLFGNALLHTPITSKLGAIVTWSSERSVFLVFLLVVIFITAMAFAGIHQIIAVPIVFSLLLTPEVNISLFAAAFMCIFSWALSSSLSPLNALNIIISSCVYTNGIKVAFTWNGKYFLAIFLLACGYVTFLNHL